MDWKFLDPRYGTLARLDYFLQKYVYLTIASLVFILPPLLLGLNYFPPFYLFFPAVFIIGYFSLLFEIRRLRDIQWSLWLLLIPLSPLAAMIPAMASLWLFPAPAFSLFDVMDYYPSAVTAIITIWNIVIIGFQALLLFVKGKAKSTKELQDEYERDIQLLEERFKSKGQNT